MSGTSVEVLVITTPWCHHCRAMQPELDRLEEAYGASMQIQRIDATVESELVGALGVQATPTLIMRIAGEEQTRLIGRVSDHDLEQFFASQGKHRPFPLDGVTRAVAGIVLGGIGWWSRAPVLVATGVVLGVWSAVAMWRWAR